MEGYDGGTIERQEAGRGRASAAHAPRPLSVRHRDELVKLLESSGIVIAGDDPWSTLRSALNMVQKTWVRGDDAKWIPVNEVRPVGTELSGRALSDAIYAFVQERYPNDRVFHYEQVKEAHIKTGVRIKGTATGPTMRAALAGRLATSSRPRRTATGGGDGSNLNQGWQPAGTAGYSTRPARRSAMIPRVKRSRPEMYIW